MESVAARGIDLYHVACEHDLEGVIANLCTRYVVVENVEARRERHRAFRAMLCCRKEAIPMLEWVALIVLVPLVIVPIVLLFGFAGCNQIYGLDPTQVAPQTTFQTELGEDVTQRNRTVVQRIEPVRLSTSGSKVTITVQRPATGMLRLLNMSISRASNVADPNRDAYDSADDLTAVLSAELLLEPDMTNPAVELPEINYALDHTQPLLIAFDVGPEGSIARTATTIGAFEAAAHLGPPPPAPQQPIHEASLADPDGDRQMGYTMQPRIYLIQRIVVR